MHKLTRRDAMKTAVAAMFLPAVMPPPQAAEAEVVRSVTYFPPLQVATKIREHEITIVGHRFPRGVWDLAKVVNADVFLYCPARTLLCDRVRSRALWMGRKNGKSQFATMNEAWKTVCTFREAPGAGWNVSTWDPEAKEFREWIIYRSKSMQSILGPLVADDQCLYLKWTIDGKVQYRAGRDPTIRQKPYMGDEDGSDG